MPSPRVIVVALQRPEQLFVADSVSPSSAHYTEYTAQPAMDTVRDDLLKRKPGKHNSIELQVVLPADQVRPGLAEDLTSAVRRWVSVQNAMDMESSGAAGAIGRRLFVLGFLAFSVLQGISILVRKLAEQTDDPILDAVAEALNVSSWVMLWFPVQMFTMEVWKESIKRQRMRDMERLTVSVRSGDR